MKFLGCCWGEVVDRLVGPLVVEEVDPVQGLQFNVFDPAPKQDRKVPPKEKKTFPPFFTNSTLTDSGQPSPKQKGFD